VSQKDGDTENYRERERERQRERGKKKASISYLLDSETIDYNNNNKY